MKRESHKNRRVILVGGGTGGHVVPIYRIHQYLLDHDPDTPVTIIGSGSEIEQLFFGGLPNYLTLSAGKFKGYDLLVNLWQAILFCAGFVQALIYLIQIRPKIIFAKGGYVTVPILTWARILRVPYFVHESDVLMGRANRFGANGAKKVFAGFPTKNYPELQKKKIEFCGQIISDEERKKPFERFDFGFKNENPVILITGGSLGAVNLNKNVFGSLSEILLKYNIIHQTGSKGYQEAINVRAALPESMKRSYFISDFLSSLDNDNKILAAMEMADLVIARAGATTVAEIAMAGKPMVLVPYPYAAGDHQTKNAKALEEAGACVTISDKDLTPQALTKIINNLFKDKERMKKMAKSAKKFFPTDAVEKISKEIIKEVSK